MDSQGVVTGEVTRFFLAWPSYVLGLHCTPGFVTTLTFNLIYTHNLRALYYHQCVVVSLNLVRLTFCLSAAWG